MREWPRAAAFAPPGGGVKRADFENGTVEEVDPAAAPDRWLAADAGLVVFHESGGLRHVQRGRSASDYPYASANIKSAALHKESSLLYRFDSFTGTFNRSEVRDFQGETSEELRRWHSYDFTALDVAGKYLVWCERSYLQHAPLDDLQNQKAFYQNNINPLLVRCLPGADAALLYHEEGGFYLDAVTFGTSEELTGQKTFVRAFPERPCLVTDERFIWYTLPQSAPGTLHRMEHDGSDLATLQLGGFDAKLFDLIW